MTNENNDLLQELEEFIRVKPKSFNITVALSAIYMLSVMAMLVKNLSFDVDPTFGMILAVLLLPPVVGIAFFLQGKTVGWIISFLYYQLVGLIVVLAFIQALFTVRSNHIFDTQNLVLYFLVFVSVLVVYFLYSKGIRDYFNIDKVKLGYLIFASFVLIVVVFVIVGIAVTSDRHR
jgi:hypothetical protein